MMNVCRCKVAEGYAKPIWEVQILDGHPEVHEYEEVRGIHKAVWHDCFNDDRSKGDLQ